MIKKWANQEGGCDELWENAERSAEEKDDADGDEGLLCGQHAAKQQEASEHQDDDEDGRAGPGQGTGQVTEAHKTHTLQFSKARCTDALREIGLPRVRLHHLSHKYQTALNAHELS